MLSGKLLAELVKDSAARDDLLELAWPSLATESKLQILTELQDSGEVSISDKMLTLAGNDIEPIVRFWAARFSAFTDVISDAERKESSGERRIWDRDRSDEVITTARQVQNDDVPLVRDMARLSVALFDGPKEPLNSRQRIIAARFPGPESARLMIEWVESLWKAEAIPEEEVCLLVNEIMRSGRIERDFLQDEMNRDGMTHFANIRDAEEIWKTAARLPQFAAQAIGFYAPVIVEKSNVLEEVFDDLPHSTQSAAVSRRSVGLEVVLEKVRENPDRYDERVVKDVERVDRYAFEAPTAEEISDTRRRAAVDREEVLIEMTLEMSEQIRELRQELGMLSSDRRRGFWGR